MEAEERGQGEAIARNLLEMSALKVPVLCILIGEGGSGGALATAVGNEVWMMENATYSILSPEGFASILWKDADRAREASEVMNITSEDLKRLGVIERIVPEYGGADQRGLVLGVICESNLRRAYTIVAGDTLMEATINILTRPVTGIIILICILVLLSPVYKPLLKKHNKEAAAK